jgi:hypothetical protein
MENEDLAMPVSVETELKEMIVNYIGERLSPEDGNVTVQMAVDVFAVEFPEFLLAIAEENFLRGYEQALVDVAAIENQDV